MILPPNNNDFISFCINLNMTKLKGVGTKRLMPETKRKHKIPYLKACVIIIMELFSKTNFSSSLGAESLSNYVFCAIFLVFLYQPFCPYPFKFCHIKIFSKK